MALLLFIQWAGSNFHLVKTFKTVMNAWEGNTVGWVE